MPNIMYTGGTVIYHLRIQDIHVNPAAWQDPMGDLFRWQAHIPGPKNVRLYFKHAFDVLIIGIFKTSWAGGVYTVNLIFDDNISDRTFNLFFRSDYQRLKLTTHHRPSQM